MRMGISINIHISINMGIIALESALNSEHQLNTSDFARVYAYFALLEA